MAGSRAAVLGEGMGAEKAPDAGADVVQDVALELDAVLGVDRDGVLGRGVDLVLDRDAALGLDRDVALGLDRGAALGPDVDLGPGQDAVLGAVRERSVVSDLDVSHCFDQMNFAVNQPRRPDKAGRNLPARQSTSAFDAPSWIYFKSRTWPGGYGNFTGAAVSM